MMNDRLFEFLSGFVTGILPIALVFVIIQLLRGKSIKDIFFNGKEFSKSSLTNYLFLFGFALSLLVILWVIITHPFATKRTIPYGPQKKYVSNSVEQCALIDYSCGPDENLFQDAEGCGCVTRGY